MGVVWKGFCEYFNLMKIVNCFFFDFVKVNIEKE